jgi:hypothetical protein
MGNKEREAHDARMGKKGHIMSFFFKDGISRDMTVFNL